MIREESIETKGTSVEQLKPQINAVENLTKERTELKDCMNVDHVDRNKIRTKVDSYDKMHLKCMKLWKELIIELDTSPTNIQDDPNQENQTLDDEEENLSTTDKKALTEEIKKALQEEEEELSNLTIEDPVSKIRIKVDSYNKMHLKCIKLCNKLIVKLDNEFTKNEFTKNEFTKNEFTKKQLGLIILLPFVIGIAFYRLNPCGTDSHSEKSNMEIYKEKMQSLQNEFPSQNNRLWKVVRVAMQEHHDKKDNLQPAVLMLASNADANPTMQCLASKLADIYSHNCPQPKFVVPENEFKHLSPESAKVLLDNKISSQFQAGSCASVVRHFELIPPAATKVFYQFCENDNAPYKNTTVILTLQVEPGDWSKPYPNLDNLLPKFWDRVVDDFLTHTLATGDPVVMTTDMIGALLSRITPSVVWVGRENDLNC